MTDHINVVYAEKKTELPWSIRLGMICEENQTEQ